ncbi:DUF4291 domain-containing protein [Serratia fonticola]|uniref:DUF4291 domain-containing protein n=1 Tax=Serratia fonticola TaxID=47917 RepID=A0AAJ2DBM8_SERFO|nr:DUF4291 domain-containing protein [Serratia fonticola]MDQ9129354.1 DUF4291 domain-containing protein [Serratia fonticola]
MIKAPLHVPERQIRAYYNDDFIRVYQAYSDEIAEAAIKNGTFTSPPFNLNRMTWIKPSFLWMMYRSGWGMKDSNQKRILAIDITHEGFREIVEQGVINQHVLQDEECRDKIRASDVVIQWDPERDIYLNKLNHRTIQIGLRNAAVENYINKWIVSITDITSLCHDIYLLIEENDISNAELLMPKESVYYSRS